eukprot:scaffold640_cov166-Amphora_coffeaeformis.AAC.2
MNFYCYSDVSGNMNMPTKLRSEKFGRPDAYYAYHQKQQQKDLFGSRRRLTVIKQKCEILGPTACQSITAAGSRYSS